MTTNNNDKTNKTSIINIKFTSHTGNSLTLLVSIDGKQEHKHIDLIVSDKPLDRYGIYEFKVIARQLSGHLDMKLSSLQCILLAARLSKAAQRFITGGN